jgi:hypothetical protein
VDELGKIRAQRAEVEALLLYRHAAPGEARVVAWWRLHRIRQGRVLMMSVEEVAKLPALPEPPEGALGPWQKMWLRLGLLRLERAAPPRAVARALGTK